jgi:hypothetical protein
MIRGLVSNAAAQEPFSSELDRRAEVFSREATTIWAMATDERTATFSGWAEPGAEDARRARAADEVAEIARELRAAWPDRRRRPRPRTPPTTAASGAVI